jgi:hypothetical protein
MLAQPPTRNVSVWINESPLSRPPLRVSAMTHVPRIPRAFHPSPAGFEACVASRLLKMEEQPRKLELAALRL